MVLTSESKIIEFLWKYLNLRMNLRIFELIGESKIFECAGVPRLLELTGESLVFKTYMGVRVLHIMEIEDF